MSDEAPRCTACLEQSAVIFGIPTQTLSDDACSKLGVAPEMAQELDLCERCLERAGMR